MPVPDWTLVGDRAHAVQFYEDDAFLTELASRFVGAALAKGAVDEVYRAPVVPSDHAVSIQVTVNGQTVTGTANVPAASQSVTYVQFAVRNGQVTSTSWAGRGGGSF